MSHSESHPWLIAYDIANPRRLVRVHRYLKRHAIPAQYSLFILYGNERKLEHVLEAIDERIDRTEDDVRAYRVPQRCEVSMLGTQGLPHGILLPIPGLQKLLQEVTAMETLTAVSAAVTVEEFQTSDEEVSHDG